MRLVHKAQFHLFALAFLAACLLLLCAELLLRSERLWRDYGELRQYVNLLYVIERKEDAVRDLAVQASYEPRNATRLDSYREELNELEELYAEGIRAAPAASDMAESLQQLQLVHRDLRQLEDRAFAGELQEGPGLLLAPSYQKACERFRADCRSMLSAVEARLNAMLGGARRFAAASAYTAGGTAGLIAVAGVLLFLLSRRTIERPVDTALKALDRLAAGDLSVELELYAARSDELGHVARACQRLLSTARERAREAVQAEQLYRAILEAAPDIICVINPDGSIRYVNPALTRQTGWTLQEIPKALKDRLWFHPEDEARMRERLRRMFEGQPVPPLEYRALHRDGHYLWLRETLHALHGPDGKVAQAVAVATDVTPMRTIQKELAQSAALTTLGAVTRGVMHDFNSIVAAIHAQAEAAVRLNDPTQYQAALKSIWRSISRANVLSRNVASLLESGAPERVACSVNEVLQVALGFVAHELARLGVSIEQHFQPSPPVLANPQQLEQVFVNIVEALRESMVSTRAALRVSTAPTDGSISVLFLDDGTGLSEPEVRLSARGGTGLTEVSEERLPGVLGLSVARRIIADLGGTIEFGFGPGRSWTVRVLLPAAPGPLPEAGRKEQELSETPAQRVLVVEAAALRAALHDFLSGRGHTVVGCASVRSAIQELRQGQFDVIFCDLSLRGSGGAHALRELLQAAPDTPVVILTADVTSDTAEEALRDGAFAYLRKPFGMEQVRDLLARIHKERRDDERADTVDR